MKKAKGAFLVAVGLGIYLWVHEHSPHMGFGEMLTKLDSYVIKEPIYTVILVVAAIFALVGAVEIVQGLQGNKK